MRSGIRGIRENGQINGQTEFAVPGPNQVWCFPAALTLSDVVVEVGVEDWERGLTAEPGRGGCGRFTRQSRFDAPRASASDTSQTPYSVANSENTRG